MLEERCFVQSRDLPTEECRLGGAPDIFVAMPGITHHTVAHWFERQPFADHVAIDVVAVVADPVYVHRCHN